MKRGGLDWLLVAGMAELALAGGTAALDIYRVGGEGEPRPAVGTFHQLSWDQLSSMEGLDAQALAAGVLRPYFLTPDQNIALTSVARGAGPYVQVNAHSYSVTSTSSTLVDADPASFYEWIETASTWNQQHRIAMNLGGVFQVNRIRLFTPHGGHYPDRLDIAASPDFVNSNDLALTGELVARVRENVRDTLEVGFRPVRVRTLDLLLYRISGKAVTLAEIEVYGQGYIGESSYVGALIDLGEPAIWGQIRWSGRKDPGARIWVQSRAGRDLDPNVYWRFTGRGDERSDLAVGGEPLDAAAYAQLKSGEAAPITYDTRNWSFWSAPYEVADSSGAAIRSPGPNSVLQLRVDFLNTVREGGEVRFIEFTATRPPLAERVVGEIYPPDVPLGATPQLTYAIRPTIRAQHSGFDEVEIAAPFGVEGVDTVKVGGVPVAFTWRVERADSTRFSVRLPRHLGSADSGVGVEVVFRSPVLRYGTAFDGWVRDSGRPAELPQPINPGDASVELPSGTLAVRTSFGDRLLGGLRVEPAIISPNADGANEEIHFSFDLLQVTAGAVLRLELFDLSGRRVRTVHSGAQLSGRFDFSWDGRDDQQLRVQPGIYLYRLAVRADQGEDHRSGTVAVVY